MSEVLNVTEIFGEDVFNDKVMQERLPKAVYKKLKKTITEGYELDPTIADAVAQAMKEWALENGATHYTHWFQPLTGITAEKHDSFISVADADGKVIMEFSGKELVRSEADASSFPSGGLRATFEARGYTIWDCTSPAFLRREGEHGEIVTLCIPTSFCSFGGEALDTKTPLLRSMETLSDSATKLLHILGKEKVTRVDTTVGSEQEYFLIDKDLYTEREDLMLTGRTLIGAPAPKGQEMEDHYFGVLKPKVSEFMHDLDQELWKLGVPAKTKHNEVAPSQHELAPVFETANIAVDHNQLTMEMMKKVADKHNYACLLHEKPFEGINGSGKHNNWSMITSEGENLLDPGKTPGKNVQFLLFLMGIVSAVDEYADLMRVSVATAGNDHRLGANEAPPAIVSIYVGDELEKVLESIENGEDFTASDSKQLETGAHVLPHFIQDNTDRNRTSPFAFTGNKFEFRMPGSSLSVADPNIVLNTAVAEALDQICAKLEHVDPKDLETEAMKLVKELLKKHRRIIFNGNGYTDEWVAEAEKRGLYNLKSLPEAMPQIKAKKNKELFEKHHVFTEIEIDSRYEIYLENYSKTIRIEALTMLEMVKKDFTDGLMAYETALTDTAIQKKQVLTGAKCTLETSILTKLDAASEAIGLAVEKLEKDLAETQKITESLALATAYHDTILADMDALRAPVDAAEEMIPETYLPYPTYSKLLFSLR